MLHVTAELRIPLREFRFTFARSAGPGGQNVNKVNSKALLRWSAAGSPSLPEAVRHRLFVQQRSRMTEEGELLISSQRFRDAGRNVADCLEKLRGMLLAAANPPKPRKPGKPTRASVRRRLEQKQRRAHQKRQRRPPPEE